MERYEKWNCKNAHERQSLQWGFTMNYNNLSLSYGLLGWSFNHLNSRHVFFSTATSIEFTITRELGRLVELHGWAGGNLGMVMYGLIDDDDDC